MSVLRTIEQKIEGLVERTFGRAFRSDLQPVELARKLAREMDEHKTVSVSRVYVPNEYVVYLSHGDRQRFSSYEASLTAELSEYLAGHARGEGLSLLSEPTVLLETDDDLRGGEFGIACRMVDPPLGPSMVDVDPVKPTERGAVPSPSPQRAVRRPLPPPPAASPLAGVSGTQILSADEAKAAGLVRESLTILIEGRRQRVSKRVTTVGRSRDCDVVVADPNVSRVHAEIRQVGVDYYMVDMDSTNGVVVNGQAVKRHALADGDVVTLGTSEIRVERS